MEPVRQKKTLTRDKKMFVGQVEPALMSVEEFTRFLFFLTTRQQIYLTPFRTLRLLVVKQALETARQCLDHLEKQ